MAADASEAWRRQEPQTAAPLAEWVVGIIGGLVALSTVVFLLVQAAASDDDLPRLRASVVERAGTTVVVEVRNEAAVTATDVVVSAGASTTTIDYVPGRSSKRVTFLGAGASVEPQVDAYRAS